MFGLIRMFAGLILTVIGAYAVRKSKIINKRKWTFFISLFTFVIITVSFFFPIENSIITFESPEKAYIYFCSYEVELIASGNETDFVSGHKHDSRSFLILPKTEKGWKTSTGNDLKIVCKKHIDGITIAEIYKHRNFDDIYVVIHGVEGNQNEISDNVGSEFQSIKSSDYGNYYMYVAHINNIEKTYCITINGEEILLMEQ